MAYLLQACSLTVHAHELGLQQSQTYENARIAIIWFVDAANSRTGGPSQWSEEYRGGNSYIGFAMLMSDV